MQNNRKAGGKSVRALPAIRLFALILAGLVTVNALSAQNSNNSGNNLTLKIAVMGPGDELYFWWGHIALVIEDSATGENNLYDYGLFDFGQENFFVNFAFGRLLYSCGVSSADTHLAYSYINDNRDVTLYTLDLPPDVKQEVKEFAENNVLPENKYYYYHHFEDNCCTRIINIIDMATKGQFKEKYGNTPGRFTLRQHVRRHTWFDPFCDWGLNFLMGQDIDPPTTVWQEMFLPSEAAARMSEFSYTDADGVTRKLVTNVEVLNKAVDRPAVLDTPRKQWPRELLFSTVIMLVIGLFCFLQTKTAAGQVLVGISHSLMGLFFGLAGSLLFFMSLFTNHTYCFHNMNLLFANPLLLAAVPLGIQYAKAPSLSSRERPEFLLRCVWGLSLLGIVLSMLLKLLPWFYQANMVDQMLMLPIVLILALDPFSLKDFAHRTFWRWL